MALHKLVFDASSADTIAASANVGAYLRSADGTLLTHTDVSGKKALDVRVAEGINVEVDLSHVDDSVKIGDGTDFLEVNADGSLNAVVSATDLDIRDLDSSTDSVTAIQGTSPWVVGDGGGSLTVDASDLDIRDLDSAQDSVAAVQSGAWTVTATATDFDIRDLSHSQDSVKVGDGTDFLAINADGSINVNATSSDAALANAALKAVAETVGTSAAQILDGADELANRKYVYLYNNGNRLAYVGESGVTTSSGFPLPPGSILDARIGAAVDVYMIADAAGQNVRTLQLS